MLNPGFVDHCVELLSPLGRVRARRMFGGHGFYVDELFVAILIGDRLFLKAAADTAPRFEAAGGEPFTYERDGKVANLGFWTPPAEAMESPELMRPWGRRAIQAALTARATQPMAARQAPKKAALRKSAAKKAAAARR